MIRISGTGAVDSPFLHTFRLAASQRKRIPLAIDAPCAIEVTAEWEGTAKTLSLILNGPGRTGYYARENGESPLRLTHIVTAREAASGKDWTVTLANFTTRESARGTVRIRRINR